MAVIQCAESCRYQQDGYCNLEKCSIVSDLNSSCPYFLPILSNNGNSLSQTSDTHKLQ